MTIETVTTATLAVDIEGIKKELGLHRTAIKLFDARMKRLETPYPVRWYNAAKDRLAVLKAKAQAIHIPMTKRATFYPSGA